MTQRLSEKRRGSVEPETVGSFASAEKTFGLITLDKMKDLMLYFGYSECYKFMLAS